jgi:hypothetical protein
MINLTRVVVNPRLSQNFQIERISEGQYINEGEWQEGSKTVLARFGVITPSKALDVVQYLPEGERTSESITIYCQEDLRMSDGKGIQSDYVLWRDKRYRIAFCKPWEVQGYYHALAVRQPDVPEA